MQESSDGTIVQEIDNSHEYTICFTSTDSNDKMVTFEYVQTHRMSHYSKSNFPKK